MVEIKKEERYDIMQNAKGEILLMVQYREGAPENPLLVYDGGELALLYRSQESNILLTGINIEARPVIKGVNEVLVVEVQGEEVLREYKASMRIVSYVKGLLA